MAANLKAHAAPAPQPKPPPKSLSMERRIPLGQHLAEAMAAASAASQALLRRVGLAAPPPPVISKAPVARYHLHLALPVWAVPKSQLHSLVSQPDNSGADGPGAPQPWDDSLPSLPLPETTQLLPLGDFARAPGSSQLGHTPLPKHWAKRLAADAQRAADDARHRAGGQPPPKRARAERSPPPRKASPDRGPATSGNAGSGALSSTDAWQPTIPPALQAAERGAPLPRSHPCFAAGAAPSAEYHRGCAIVSGTRARFDVAYRRRLLLDDLPSGFTPAAAAAVGAPTAAPSVRQQAVEV